MFESIRRFEALGLDVRQSEQLREMARYAGRDILRMTTRAGSGHPGGSLSSVGIYLLLLTALDGELGDRLVVSHGHTAAGLYAALGLLGVLNLWEAAEGFRRKSSVYEGHPSLKVPGVSWCSGALGQGLSVGCGFAAAAQMQNRDSRVYVVMGDGEQAKGQLAEAREFAYGHHLSNLTAIIDYNGLQASGSLEQVMHQDIAAKYEAAGWIVERADGHDFAALYEALKKVSASDRPGLVIAETIMGYGVKERENDYRFHGTPLTQEQWDGCEMNFPALGPVYSEFHPSPGPEPARLKTGRRIVYDAAADMDMRSAFGAAIFDIAEQNNGEGIAEQNAVTAACAMAKSGTVTFAAGFGAFMVDEVYSQLRMGDINQAPLQIVATHCGLDVGEDGKTHQCLDYVSLLSNLQHLKTLIPADPNQTDAIVRYMARSKHGNCLCTGRSKTPVLLGEDGSPFFGKEYQFRYGEGHWLREGKDAVVISMGGMVPRALQARELLKEQGIEAAVYLVSCPGIYVLEDLKKAAESGLVVTYEDHFFQSGMGAGIAAAMMENGLNCKLVRLGVTAYGCSATPEELYQMQGLSPTDLANEILRRLLS